MKFKKNKLDKMYEELIEAIYNAESDSEVEEYVYKLEQVEKVRKANKKDRTEILELCKIGVSVAGIVLPLVFYNKWMKEGLKFEQEGTFTSQTFKGLLGKVKPN